ncbi:hypothetical protein [Cylindrospermum sp. FACHB-282]|uniref:hypothetical protein n=1 Tax=Cylindrospermum sp. FACHB-282 TaxID=2692794 RepID=UPI00168274B5|nr:hypothetical protein [Cylindrospermum sp. FACHB-282]MBD2385826.1 hypothetical protein [Cylindrospermum sp. FACHB-282]
MSNDILQEADQHLRRLYSEKLWVVSNFMVYLEEKEEEDSTALLLKIPGFEQKPREGVGG